PKRTRLCDWCSFQSLCPEFGGTPPALPVIPVPRVPRAGESAAVA
ncbi:MAG: recombinase RecB, partial [Gemmatimonadales bacterium]